MIGRDGVGTVTVATVQRPGVRIVQADQVADFSLDLVCDPSYTPGIRVRDGVITLDAENGMLKYEIIGWVDRTRALRGRLIFSTVAGVGV